MTLLHKSLQAKYQSYLLRFRFEACTSRGTLQEKRTWFIGITHTLGSHCIGLGEIGPVPGLSIDDQTHLEAVLGTVCEEIVGIDFPESHQMIEQIVAQIVPQDYPTIQFGLETALLDLMHGGQRLIFPNAFTQGQKTIPINGLIWMGNEANMRQQIKQKLQQGFSCLKMKICSTNFETIVALLKYIRKAYPQHIVRLDANGAFVPEEALEKLHILAQYQIHSIEQPIAPNHPIAMAQLCKKSPIPIALDEALIGIHTHEAKKNLLVAIKPQYIVLKPTLLGGFKACKTWIALAESQQIPWWITSSLESNIGLNAISQFTASFNVTTHQGLGTGQLYNNNIPSPLAMQHGFLQYDLHRKWNLKALPAWKTSKNNL